MPGAAIFVDAGYLFAQGSVALSGSKKPRSEMKLNETAVVSELMSVAKAKGDCHRILRIYWYDASNAGRGLSLEHSNLAHTDYIKLRLGQLNSEGQQSRQCNGEWRNRPDSARCACCIIPDFSGLRQ